MPACRDKFVRVRTQAHDLEGSGSGAVKTAWKVESMSLRECPNILRLVQCTGEGTGAVENFF